MKRFFLLFFIFLLLPSVLAVEFDINQNFSQGETIIAKISGNFLTPITNENIFFYDGHVRIPLEYAVSKIGEDYYLYALTYGKSPGVNYSVSIQQVQYMRGSEATLDNIAANFSITNSTADFSVSPGFITTSGDFSLEVQNLQDKKLNLGINTESNISTAREILVSPDMSSSSVLLNSGEIKKINFQLGSGKMGLRMIELKTDNLIYKVPVYIFSSSAGNIASLEIDPQFLTLSAPLNSTSKTSIFIFNSGDKTLQNISLSLSDSLISSLNLSQFKIESLNAKSGIQIDLSYFSKSEKKVEGILKIKSENTTASSFISLTFMGNYTVPKENVSVLTKTCAEYQGKVCSQNEQCDKDPVYAKDNVCCLGVCKPKATNSSGIIIGILLLAIIIGALFLLYKKYKKTKKPVDLLEIAKGKHQTKL